MDTLIGALVTYLGNVLDWISLKHFNILNLQFRFRFAKHLELNGLVDSGRDYFECTTILSFSLFPIFIGKILTKVKLFFLLNI